MLFISIVLAVFSSVVHGLASPVSIRRTVIITGANSGIGFEACKVLAASGQWDVIMACRSLSKAENAKAKLGQNGANVEIRQLDLADLSSVKQFCQSWGNRPLHVLANNAGTQKQTDAFSRELIKGDSVPRTKQGFEETVGVNHLGHFLLTQLLLNNLKATSGGSRVVWTGSGVHDPDQPGGDVGSKATLGDLSGLKAGFKPPVCMVDNSQSDYDPDKAYKDSKLCNVMTSLELARRLQATASPVAANSATASAPLAVTSNVFNPGLIPTTGLFRELNSWFVLIFTILTKYVFKVAETEEEGGRRLAFMIADLSLDRVTGAYYTGKPFSFGFQLFTPSKEAQDQNQARALWEVSEQIVGKNI